MSEPSADRDPFEIVAESFLTRFRAGQRPSIEEYAASHPELADQIRELLPALVMVEQDLTVDRNLTSDGSRAVAPPDFFKERRLGDYRILREVGRGGMGVVYEAEQISLGRRVALKVLPGHLASDATGLERFRREAKAAARLHHTNIVPVFEVGREGEVAYYAMQFIQGQGLDQIIDELARLHESGTKPGGVKSQFNAVFAASAPGRASIGPIAESVLRNQFATEMAVPPAHTPPMASLGTPATDRVARAAMTTPNLAPASRGPERTGATPASGSRAVLTGGNQASSTYLSGKRSTYFRSVAGIGSQAAQGLAYAHAGGIVHRDIKPGNLLLDHAGVVWIADFGLAKADDDGLTQSGDILGTLRYMAPERFRGQGDARADVYALGLTLYEMLSLRPAFQSTDRLKLIEQINAEEPRRLRNIDPRIPRDLETIVLKAIEKDPSARYQSAEVMAEDLRLFLANEPIRARQVSTSERYWRWARRNPAIAALGGVLMALLIATSVGSTWAASYFRTLAGSESLANRQSKLAQKQAVQAREAADNSRQQAVLERDLSRRLSAGLALDKGLALAEAGHADRGLLWMLEALKTAPNDAKEFRTTVRLNLGSWLGQVPRPLRIFENGPGSEMAFSPDGRTFAQADAPNYRTLARSVSLRDTDSGRELASFPDAFPPFAFRPDGLALIGGLKNRKHLAAFDLTSGRVIWVSPDLPGEVGRTIFFGSGGSTIFVECDQGSSDFAIARLDAGTGELRGEPIRSRGPSSLALDARTMATVRLENGQTHVDLIDTSSGRRTISWKIGHEMIFGLGFNPDGKSLVVGSSPNQDNDKSSIVQVWDPIEGRPMSRPIRGALKGRYSLAGDRLIVEKDFKLAMLDASNMERGSRFPVGGSFALNPDGRTVISQSSDFITRLWQISSDSEPVLERVSSDPPSVPSDSLSRKPRLYQPLQGGRLRSDGQVAALLAEDPGGRELIRLFDPATFLPLGKPLPHYSGWVVRSLAFSPDGHRFATASNRPDHLVGVIRVCDAKTGRLLFPPITQTNHVAALAFHPNGKILAAGDYNGYVQFWDTTTGREINRPLFQGDIVLSLAYSPDGTILAVGLSSERKKPGVRLWNPEARKPIGELFPSVEEVEKIVFRPDGGAFLGGNWQSARLWDRKHRSDIGEPMVGEAVGVFRPDGRAFLTLGRDGSVKIRDAFTGAVLSKPLSATSPATCAAFRGDGGLLVAGFEDGAVRLEDLATSQQIGPTRFMKSTVETGGFSPDGRTIYAIDRAGEFRKWPVPDPPQDASLDDLTLRLEARTGLRLDASLAISRLDSSAWRERLERLGRLDPAALKIDDGPDWHEPMAREAERTGNGFAAIWHLDRLIRARPDDWHLHARRAFAWSLSGGIEKAAADYRQAERLGGREEILNFQNHCVLECVKAEHWAEALWYLDRLIAGRPDDVSLHENRATVCGKLGREVDRQASLARVFEQGADQEMVIHRAEELGRDGRWPEAASLLARCGRQGFLSKDLAQAWGIACLRAGDRAGYREVCAAVLAREWPNPTVQWNALSAASLMALAPGALEDYRVPMAYFERVLTIIPATDPQARHLFSNARGGLLLRVGRIDEVIALIEGAISATKEPQLPTDWAFLALAHAQKGSFAEARRWLDRLHSVRQAPSDSPWDLQGVALLREEAESLLSDAAFPSDPFQHPKPR